jgi:hypothetical protein
MAQTPRAQDTVFTIDEWVVPKTSFLALSSRSLTPVPGAGYSLMRQDMWALRAR